MILTRGSVHRPILTTIIFIIIITLGIVSFLRLSIDLMPEITYPSISVSTEYGNVGPQEMEELISRPIEEAIALLTDSGSIEKARCYAAELLKQTEKSLEAGFPASEARDLIIGMVRGFG
mgnify:CR=1 FL=1